MTFQSLAAGPESDPAIVTPALPAILGVLAQRELSATFFVTAEIPEQEPAALTMIASGWNEIAALSAGEEDDGHVLAALAAAGRPASGLRAQRSDVVVGQGHGLAYLSAPGDEITDANGLVLIPFDPAASDAAFLAPQLVGRDRPRPGGPQGLHESLQVAIADALRNHAHLTLTFFPGLLDRSATLAVFIETLDLLHGLSRAGRLWLPTLEQLATWWREDSPPG